MTCIGPFFFTYFDPRNQTSELIKVLRPIVFRVSIKREVT